MTARVERRVGARRVPPWRAHRIDARSAPPWCVLSTRDD
jgi:hypothetical protein